VKRWLALVAFVAAVFGASPAGAVYQCGPDKDDCQCGMNNPYPCCENGGNCTWWSWEKACCNWKVGLPGWGNANQWSGNAKAHPSYEVLSKPVANSIGTRVSGSYGHVVWVTAVNGGSITVTEQNCWGGWGHQTATYNPSYFDGGFVVPKSTCECQVGQTQTESCGNCGEKSRSCNAACQWGAWSDCGGQGECAPGDVDEQTCGECGHKSRSCKNDCSWDAFSTCNGLDPNATTECDTGSKGVCAKGTEKCSNGEVKCVPDEKPSAEVCDGLDNDCDGWSDDGASCDMGASGGSGSLPPDDEESVQKTELSKLEEGGCAMSARKVSSGWSSLLLLGLVLLGTRRRRFDIV
jgi:surface antigen